MSFHRINGGSIRSIFNVIPAYTVDNLTEELIPATDRESMVAHTGIRFRRKFPEETVTTTQLFIEGIKRTLSKLQWAPSDISALVCVTQTPETHIPAVSCVLHNEFKLPATTACLDINLGCSGYVYGLHQLFSLLQNQIGESGRALLCCGDITSSLIQNDKSTVPIFSDGISVTAVEFDRNTQQEDRCSYFNLETLGSGHTAIRSEFEGHKEVMRLNGIEVFNYSVQFVPKHIKELLQLVDKERISLVVLHQANKLINDAIAKRISLPQAYYPSTLYRYGNMASASIPITLVDYLSSTAATDAISYVLLSGFGVGFSMGSVVLPLASDIKYANLEFPISSNEN